MEDLEKQIEEAAINYISGKGAFQRNPFNESNWITGINAFKFGAKSEAAKEYWQQGMYSEEDLIGAIKFTISQWISDNERMEPDHRDLVYLFTHHDLPMWFEQNKKK